MPRITVNTSPQTVHFNDASPLKNGLSDLVEGLWRTKEARALGQQRLALQQARLAQMGQAQLWREQSNQNMADREARLADAESLAEKRYNDQKNAPAKGAPASGPAPAASGDQGEPDAETVPLTKGQKASAKPGPSKMEASDKAYKTAVAWARGPGGAKNAAEARALSNQKYDQMVKDSNGDLLPREPAPPGHDGPDGRPAPAPAPQAAPQGQAAAPAPGGGYTADPSVPSSGFLTMHRSGQPGVHTAGDVLGGVLNGWSGDKVPAQAAPAPVPANPGQAAPQTPPMAPAPAPTPVAASPAPQATPPQAEPQPGMLQQRLSQLDPTSQAQYQYLLKEGNPDKIHAANQMLMAPPKTVPPVQAPAAPPGAVPPIQNP